MAMKQLQQIKPPGENISPVGGSDVKFDMLGY